MTNRRTHGGVPIPASVSLVPPLQRFHTAILPRYHSLGADCRIHTCQHLWGWRHWACRWWLVGDPLRIDGLAFFITHDKDGWFIDISKRIAAHRLSQEGRSDGCCQAYYTL